MEFKQVFKPKMFQLNLAPVEPGGGSFRSKREAARLGEALGSQRSDTEKFLVRGPALHRLCQGELALEICPQINNKMSIMSWNLDQGIPTQSEFLPNKREMVP